MRFSRSELKCGRHVSAEMDLYPVLLDANDECLRHVSAGNCRKHRLVIGLQSFACCPYTHTLLTNSSAAPPRRHVPPRSVASDIFRCHRPEKYTIKPERKEIAAVSIDLTRHDDFQGPRKLEVRWKNTFIILSGVSCVCGGTTDGRRVVEASTSDTSDRSTPLF